MQTRNRFRRFACFVLAWFALSVGVAIASPFVNPQSVQLVCSTNGDVKVVVSGDDGAHSQSRHTLDCPLCVHFGSAAPPPMLVGLPQIQPQTHALRSVVTAPIAARTAAPPPARGPPNFS